MGMIKDAWDAAKEILRLSADIKTRDKKQRDELADVLTRIADVLEAIYNKLKENIYPTAYCASLETFAEDLYNSIHLIIGDEKALQLSTLLKPADKLEKLFHEITNGLVSYAELQKLEEASGKFKVGSLLIK